MSRLLSSIIIALFFLTGSGAPHSAPPPPTTTVQCPNPALWCPTRGDFPLGAFTLPLKADSHWLARMDDALGGIRLRQEGIRAEAVVRIIMQPTSLKDMVSWIEDSYSVDGAGEVDNFVLSNDERASVPFGVRYAFGANHEARAVRYAEGVVKGIYTVVQKTDYTGAVLGMIIIHARPLPRDPSGAAEDRLTLEIAYAIWGW